MVEVTVKSVLPLVKEVQATLTYIRASIEPKDDFPDKFPIAKAMEAFL